MGVGILIITHDGVGSALLNVAVNVYGSAPLPVEVLAASRDSDPEILFKQASGLAERLDSGNGVLVLSDLFGSTPSNVAARVADDNGGRLVAGLNLPMLVRMFNYPELDLDGLAEKAAEGGRDGVVIEKSP